MIFIVGAHATGKTHLADIVCEFNFTKIDLGPILRDIYKKSKSTKSFTEWVNEGEEKFGKNFTDNLLVEEIKHKIINLNNKETKPIDFVITGSRSITGLQYILEHIGKYNNINNKIIFLEAPFDVMYERYKKREGIDITIEQFKEILERDKKMGLEDLRQIADFVVINDSTHEKLQDQITKLLRNELKYKLSENTWETELKTR
ncbi:MAG: AAA family ATPase [bacterium]|nr:AAA family ATPase [bacterium]